MGDTVATLARGLPMLSPRPLLMLMLMPGGTATTVDTTAATGPTAMLATDTGTARGLPMLSPLLMLMPGGTTATATDCGLTATTGPTATATRTMVEQFHPFYVSVVRVLPSDQNFF